MHLGNAIFEAIILELDIHYNPLADDKILGWPKLKQIADDILKCI